MLNQPVSTTRQLGRYLLAAPLVMALALGYSSAQAQVTPTLLPARTPKPLSTNADYYLDGQKVGPDVLAKTDPEEISYINVIKGSEQQKLFGSTAAEGTVVITTKTKANTPAVLAFNKRINDVKPLVPASPEQEAATKTIMGYVAKNYPNAKLEMVGPARDKAGRYQAIFKEADQRMSLLFDAKGQPVAQSSVDQADLASDYTRQPAQVNALVPKALAYITSHYPDARLSGEVIKLTAKDTGAVKYQVQLINGRRPFYVYFTPQGEFAGGE